MKCNRLDGHMDLCSADGRVTPCCLFDTSHGWKSNIYTGDVDEEWEDARNRLKKDWIPECSICEINEKNGHMSMRQSKHKHIKHGMQISLDFTCNFMCRICKPSLSSKWDSINEDWTRFDKEHYYKDENRKLFPGAQEKFLNYIDLSELELVRIVGGEPFLSKRLPEFLKKLSKKSKILFNTNGSIFPDSEILNLLDTFSSVQVDISIDAIGSLAECIRYGTVWENVEKNIEKHIKQWNEVYIYSTISLLNVNKMNEVYDFANGDQYHGGRSMMNELINPSFLRLEQIPFSYRKKWGIHELKGLNDFNNIIYSKDEIQLEHQKAVDFLNTCDKHQGIKFKDVNPEIWEIINEN
jgi:MoaA/NifB/PqqE/SkfB family radical SAM enzyme